MCLFCRWPNYQVNLVVVLRCIYISLPRLDIFLLRFQCHRSFEIRIPDYGMLRPRGRNEAWTVMRPDDVVNTQLHQRLA